MQNILLMVLWIILFIVCIHTLQINEENFMTYKDNVFQQKSIYNGRNYDDHITPEERGLHKIRKIKKKLLLLCLLNGNGDGTRRYARYMSLPEGRIFFPIVQQNTDVNVGGSTEVGQDDSGINNNESGLLGNVNCNRILNSGSGIGAISHPLLGGLGNLASVISGGSNQQESTDNDNDNRFHRNINKNIVRPIYKSMKHIYRYFK